MTTIEITDENNIVDENLIKEVIQNFEELGYKGFSVGEDYKLIKINKN